MNINAEIFKGVNKVGRKKFASIDLYAYPTEFYLEIEKAGLISRMKITQMLGDIPTKKKESYSRFEYVMLQLFLYQFVKVNLKGKIRPSLNNQFKAYEFRNSVIGINDLELKSVTIAELLQLLAFILNIGHYNNTFTSSRTLIKVLNSDEKFLLSFLGNFKFDCHKKIAIEIIKTNSYHEFHLLNSILLLQQLNQDAVIVKLCINLLTEYLSKNSVSEKFQHLFKLFKAIREVCITILDLSIAPLPIYFDLSNDKYLVNLLTERLSSYNNQRQISFVFEGLNKLLQDSLYHEEKYSISMNDFIDKRSKRLVKSHDLQANIENDYLRFFNLIDECVLNPLNEKFAKINDFIDTNILKITFEKYLHNDIILLCDKLSKISFVRAAWYFRKNEDRVTLIVTIKKNASNQIKTSFKVFRLIINSIKKFQSSYNVENYHDQILLSAKFLLYFILKNHHVNIDGRLNDETFCILENGSKKRIKSIKKLVLSNPRNATKDEIHEVDFLVNVLNRDRNNDLCLSICASIIVKDNDNLTLDIAEFDGLIIYPNRVNAQIVFLESKNTKYNPSLSKKCLSNKFTSLDLEYKSDNFQTLNRDCYYEMSI